MAESPTYTTAQIIALAKGTTNWYEYAKSGFQHVKNAQDDISTLQSAAFSGATPGWNAAIDTRWYVADNSSSTTTYTGSTNPTATGSDALFTGYSIIFKPATTNTGSSTLNLGTSDGAVTIKKLSSGTLQNLSAGDFDSDAFYLLAFDGTNWVIAGSEGGADPTEVLTNKISPSSGTSFTFGDLGDTFTVPSGATLDIASGATIDVTNATKTGFPQGGLRHITTVTNTIDSSSIDIPGCFSSTYKNYRVVMNNITPVTNTTHVYLNFGNSDLSTIRDGYQWILGMYPAGFAFNQTYSENVTSGSAGIKLTQDSSNNLLYGVNMVIDVFNPYSSSTYTAFSGHGEVFNNAGNWGNIYVFAGSVRVSPATQDESLRITAQVGNMDGNTLCSVSVYGYAES